MTLFHLCARCHGFLERVLISELALRGARWIAPHLLLLKLNKDSCVINVSLIIVLLLTSTSSLAFHYSVVGGVFSLTTVKLGVEL